MAGKARGASRAPKELQAIGDSLGLPANLVRKVRRARKAKQAPRAPQARPASKG